MTRPPFEQPPRPQEARRPPSADLPPAPPSPSLHPTHPDHLPTGSSTHELSPPTDILPVRPLGAIATPRPSILRVATVNPQEEPAGKQPDGTATPVSSPSSEQRVAPIGENAEPIRSDGQTISEGTTKQVPHSSEVGAESMGPSESITMPPEGKAIGESDKEAKPQPSRTRVVLVEHVPQNSAATAEMVKGCDIVALEALFLQGTDETRAHFSRLFTDSLSSDPEKSMPAIQELSTEVSFNPFITEMARSLRGTDIEIAFVDATADHLEYTELDLQINAAHEQVTKVAMHTQQPTGAIIEALERFMDLQNEGVKTRDIYMADRIQEIRNTNPGKIIGFVVGNLHKTADFLKSDGHPVDVVHGHTSDDYLWDINEHKEQYPNDPIPLPLLKRAVLTLLYDSYYDICMKSHIDVLTRPDELGRGKDAYPAEGVHWANRIHVRKFFVEPMTDNEVDSLLHQLDQAKIALKGNPNAAAGQAIKILSEYQAAKSLGGRRWWRRRP